MAFVCKDCNRGYLAMPGGRECFSRGCNGTVKFVSDIHDGDRDGKTYEAKFDYDRLNRQQRIVFDLMKDGKWRTLFDISHTTGVAEASVSARLRDFRKERFGGFTVERNRRDACGTWWYQLQTGALVDDQKQS
jgi:hypothetical protein